MFRKIGNQLICGSVVQALAIHRYYINTIKVLQNTSSGLVNGRSDGHWLIGVVSQVTEQCDTLQTRHRIESTCWLVQNENVGRVDQFQGNGKSLLLTTTAVLCTNILATVHAQFGDDGIDQIAVVRLVAQAKQTFQMELNDQNRKMFRAYLISSSDVGTVVALYTFSLSSISLTFKRLLRWKLRNLEANINVS